MLLTGYSGEADLSLRSGSWDEWGCLCRALICFVDSKRRDQARRDFEESLQDTCGVGPACCTSLHFLPVCCVCPLLKIGQRLRPLEKWSFILKGGGTSEKASWILGHGRAWRNSAPLASYSWLTSLFSSRIFQLLGRWWVSVMLVSVLSKLGKSLFNLFFPSLQKDVSLGSELYICPLLSTHFVKRVAPRRLGSVILSWTHLSWTSPIPAPPGTVMISVPFPCCLYLTPSLLSISGLRNHSDWRWSLSVGLAQWVWTSNK